MRQRRFRRTLGCSRQRRSVLFVRIRQARALQCAESLRQSDPAEEFQDRQLRPTISFNQLAVFHFFLRSPIVRERLNPTARPHNTSGRFTAILLGIGRQTGENSAEAPGIASLLPCPARKCTRQRNGGYVASWTVRFLGIVSEIFLDDAHDLKSGHTTGHANYPVLFGDT